MTRTNWSKGDNKKKMDKAVKDWLGKTGDRLDTNSEVIFTMNKFCRIVQIPINTFQKYVCNDPNTRRIITDSVGREPIIPKRDQKFIAGITARHDRANDGLKVCAVIVSWTVCVVMTFLFIAVDNGDDDVDDDDNDV